MRAKSGLYYFGALLSLTLLAHLVQDFLPAFRWAAGAQVFIVWALFFTVAAAVPFPVMLAFAVVNGLLWEARHHVLTNPDMALAFGYYILLLGLTGSFMQGIRPMFRRGRWELPVLMTGATTFLLLLADYLLINLRRGGIYFPRELWTMMGTSALLTMLVSPLVFFLAVKLANYAGYRIKYEGLYPRRAEPESVP